MKYNLALATAALTLIGASAHAQLLLTTQVAIDPVNHAPIIDPLNGYTEFTGTITNPTFAPITLTSSSFTNAVGANLLVFDIQADPDLTDLINPDNSFLTLNAATPGAPGSGGNHTFSDLFEVDLTGGVSMAGFTYQLGGTADPTGNTGNHIVASYTFAQPSAVPEPGSIALLASSVIGGGLFMSRRRRK